MSNLEKFVRRNRSDFDDESPSADVWKNLEKTIPVRKEKHFTIRDIYKWSAAAAIFFIALTSAYFLFIRKHNLENKQDQAKQFQKPDDINSIAPEYASEFKQAYQSVLDGQQQLKVAASSQPELYNQFLHDLAALDSSYRMLKNQVGQTPNRDLIIKAMIDNLRLQAELLNRQLLIFNQFHNSKNSKNEKNT